MGVHSYEGKWEIGPWEILTKISLLTAMGNSFVRNIGNCESLACDVNGF